MLSTTDDGWRSERKEVDGSRERLQNALDLLEARVAASARHQKESVALCLAPRESLFLRNPLTWKRHLLPLSCVASTAALDASVLATCSLFCVLRASGSLHSRGII